MGIITITICLLLVVISLTSAEQMRFYKPQYDYTVEDFKPIMSYFDHHDAVVPFNHRQARRISVGDRSLEKDRPKYRYEPELEDLGDYDEEVEDDRAYTVGARIKVQHPPTSSVSYKNPNHATSFTNFKIAHEPAPTKKFHKNRKLKLRTKKPIFKPSREIEHEYSDEDLSSSNINKDPDSFRQREYEQVASKGQIAKFLEDQQKLIDEVIQLRLLNDPSPGSRAKYQQFLKAKDDERIEKEYEEELKRRPLALFKPHIEKTNRRFPRKNHKKRSDLIPSSSFRSRSSMKPFVPPQTMSFRLEI